MRAVSRIYVRLRLVLVLKSRDLVFFIFLKDFLVYYYSQNRSGDLPNRERVKSFKFIKRFLVPFTCSEMKSFILIGRDSAFHSA